MLRFYTRQQFGRSGSVAVHEHGATAVRVIQVGNGRVTVDRIREHGADGRDGFLVDLDAQMAEFGFAQRT